MDSLAPTGHPWLDDLPGFPPGTLPAVCDTAVVGAGLAGAWMALELARTGASVVLLERDRVAHGASGNAGGLVLAALPWCYATAAARLGREAAREWRSLLELNHAWLDDELAGCRSGVQYMRTGSLCMARDDGERRLLEHSARLLVEDGFAAESWTADQLLKRLGAGPFAGALYQPEDGTLHPGLLVAGLANRLREAGGALLEHTPVLSCDPGPAGWRLGTPSGPLDCRQVVWCTGSGLAEDLSGTAAMVEAGCTQTLLTIRERKVLALPGYTADGSHRWRQAERGEVLLEGPGPAGETEVPDSVIHGELGRFLASTQPKLASVATRMGWVRRVTQGRDGRPLAGALPGRPGQFLLGGLGANEPGQVFVLGRLLAERMTRGVEDPRLALFDPSRSGGDRTESCDTRNSRRELEER